MAREGHFGDAAGIWNAINRELWSELGMKVPLEAVQKIREIRRQRNGRQGNTEMKRETKILLAIRQGMDWRKADFLEIDHIQACRNGGEENAANIRLISPKDNQEKGAR